MDLTLKDNVNTITWNWLIGAAVEHLNGFRDIARLLQLQNNGQICGNNQQKHKNSGSMALIHAQTYTIVHNTLHIN